MYHTALHVDDVQAPRLYDWERDGNRAFVHDITLGLPLEFAKCDVLYAEPPWADGYDEFNSRAGVRLAMPYEKWCYRLNGTLALSGKPWLISVGAAAMRCIGAEWIRRYRINGSTAAIMGAGLDPIEAVDEERLLQKLAQRFKCVGDFTCGYGRSARVFTQAGRKFMATDINPKCIGVVAQSYPDWVTR